MDGSDRRQVAQPGRKRTIAQLSPDVRAGQAYESVSGGDRANDWQHPERNRFVVTTEFELRTGALREPRLDVVCLVNGIPLAPVETKAPTYSWHEAAHDFRTYWADAPELERYSAICIATNGLRVPLCAIGRREVGPVCRVEGSVAASARRRDG
jgi:Type I restriction enzyme R protein N terminus (HSDR_N)